MRSRAQLTDTARSYFPLARLALCLACDVCFEIGPETCPACGSETWSPLSRFIGDTSEKAAVRAVRALVEEARGLSAARGGQHLLIVSRTQPKLFEMLQRELMDNQAVTVIQDRRGMGPMPTGRLPNQRWRNVDFQIRALGWAIVRAESPARAAAARA
ncbi:MAG TPA: hypothetical protein VFL90_12550 [Methylomirabilota bacterium]|nr:hypothetical protein [Methylomirabilota bacterium]